MSTLVPETLKREERPFDYIKNNFQKIIIVNEDIPKTHFNEKGYLIVKLSDFLLDDNLIN